MSVVVITKRVPKTVAIVKQQIARPVLLAVSPNTGPIAGGTAVTLTGYGFTGAIASSLLQPGFTVVNDTTITGVTVPGAVGVVSATVTNAIATSAPLANAFTYVLANQPVVTSINKSLGDFSGGTAVTIMGSNFLATGAATAATVCGVAITSFLVVSDTTITGVTAAMVASAVPGAVSVTGPGGTGTLNSAFEAFKPTNISGCIQWLRADLGVTLNGSNKITKWADQSGTGVDMTDAHSLGFLPSQPTVGLNGKLVVPFSAGDYGSNGDRLDNNTLPAGFTGVAAAEAFLILGGNVADPNGVWSYGPTGVGPWLPFSGNVYESFFLNGRPAGTATVSLSGPCEYNVQSPGTNLSAFINKVSVGLSAGGVFAAPADITIGNNHSGGGCSQTIPELIVYGRVLSAPERARVRLYENDRYGFSL